MKLFRQAAVLPVMAAIAALAVSGCGAAGKAPTSQTSAAATSNDWSVKADFTQKDGSQTVKDYQPLAKSDVKKDWRICALFPNVQDALWVAANYGNYSEAKRLGVTYNLFQAGGYVNLSTQLNQMDDCINQKYDAVILGAISATGNCASIQKALNAGIAVIDFINGTACGPQVTSSHLYTRVSVSYKQTSQMIGRYIVKHAKGAQQLASFPGPDGAAFANDAVSGLNQAIAGSDVKLEVTRRGDTGLDTQLSLITNTLQAYPKITDIFGVDAAAEAGSIAVKNASKTGVGVYGYTIIPDLYSYIQNGTATAAAADWTPFQGRISMDQAIRLLQNSNLGGTTVGPQPTIIDSSNVNKVAYADLFGPKGFKPVYSVAPAQ